MKTWTLKDRVLKTNFINKTSIILQCILSINNCTVTYLYENKYTHQTENLNYSTNTHIFLIHVDVYANYTFPL